ncbi:DUF6377 domain-containing protein [Flammeovirga agarivorans]|uniref:DUF6377 domain-containing protein n=1 Tax=Flammeovirga agarivorans TaxID=2726742 RepID=A0A7X8XTU9_9BACT|nr:DUF6377 domain-containing protein [Flammeovirga agarivorans]NLR89762.1 hypothetical protein [Flammeovirga agarivorans]
MNTFKYIFFLVFVILLGLPVIADNEFLKLDELLEERDVYLQKRIESIKQLKITLRSVKNKKDQFDVLYQITQQYLPYNSDSSLTYALKVDDISKEIEDENYQIKADIVLAQSYALVGLYHESMMILNRYKDEDSLGSNVIDYYSINAHLYNTLTLLNLDDNITKVYRKRWRYFENGIKNTASPNSISYLLSKAELLKDEGKLNEAIVVLNKLLSSVQQDDRIFAPTAYTLGDTYGRLGDVNKKIHYLILSTESDVLNGVKEHASLRELAVELYKLGEIKRAYKYIKIALDDALESNTQLRRYEVLEILPLIDTSYQANRDKVSQIMRWFVTVSSILLLITFSLLFFFLKQKKKLEHSNQEVSDKNSQLSELNEELQTNKEQVEAINDQLRSFNLRQEESITRYLKLCSMYIGKMDDYRRTLLRKANKSPKEEVLKLLKSKDVVDTELKVFYKDFDESFLKLYPHFVEDYNQLMIEDAQITLKKNELLNTELRVFALVRLGIEESSQIAEFLRYSITTIYNYRTKARNNAKAGRDQFEIELMKIGG